MQTNTTASHPYLCVCGQTIQVTTDEGGSCETCGREYSPTAVHLSMTMTMDLSTPEPPPEGTNEDDMIGRSLDHFTIIDRLGGGGMGTVYRGMDESLQRYVAIKVIRPGAKGAKDSQHVDRLLQEARAQARVNHANVVHIYFVSRDREMPYLAMELVPGQTLAERIAEGPMTYRETVNIGLQIASALRESTQYDIVHGDIKPSNILLHGDLAKLSDFGLAQRLSRSDPASGKVAGTPNYMAPETCRGEPTTSHSDMYSFGVMLFEMTFGRLPYTFDDSSVKSRLDAHQHTRPEFPAIWPSIVPEAWRPFLQRLLEKEPVDRFKNWDALIAQMRFLRPLRPVAAGRVKRGIAWCFDLFVLTFAVLMVGMAVGNIGSAYYPDSTVVQVLAIASLGIVPTFVMWWISRGGTSPGKKLMQLRVVDRHGLPVSPSVLARRSVIQYLPIWCLPLGVRTGKVGLPDFAWQTVFFGMGAFFLVDIFLGIVRRDGRSLHDQIFDTRVVLQDAREERW